MSDQMKFPAPVWVCAELGNRPLYDAEQIEAIIADRLASLAPGGDIAAMVNRFLAWPLPKDFAPDAGIQFTPGTIPHAWPSGTNLLNADQAKAMFAHVMDSPAPAAEQATPKAGDVARLEVTDAMVDRYVEAVNAHLGGLAPKDWEIERFNPAEPIRRAARIGLEAALAATTGEE